jgi:hypothetical protein
VQASGGEAFDAVQPDEEKGVVSPQLIQVMSAWHPILWHAACGTVPPR